MSKLNSIINSNINNFKGNLATHFEWPHLREMSWP